jgi:hypothetical protein
MKIKNKITKPSMTCKRYADFTGEFLETREWLSRW